MATRSEQSTARGSATLNTFSIGLLSLAQHRSDFSFTHYSPLPVALFALASISGCDRISADKNDTKETGTLVPV